MYAVGWVVPEDIVQSYMWFILAASKGDENVIDDKKAAAELMTPYQIKEAERSSASGVRCIINKSLRESRDHDLLSR